MQSSQLNFSLAHESFTTTIETDHQDMIHDLAYNSTGKLLATCSADQTIKIWKLGPNTKAQLMQTITKQRHTHKSAIRCICWAHSSFGSIFATCSIDKKINIFHLVLEKETNIYPMNKKRKQKKKQNYLFYKAFDHIEREDIIDIRFAPFNIGLKLAVVLECGDIKMMEFHDIIDLRACPMQTIKISKCLMFPTLTSVSTSAIPAVRLQQNMTHSVSTSHLSKELIHPSSIISFIICMFFV